MIDIRPAQLRDNPALQLLLRPHIERGDILASPIDTKAFIVATRDDELVGAVAIRPLSDAIAELGSLVSEQPGVGLGARLVKAALKHATHSGFELIVALTAIPTFFERLDFTVSAHAPWIEARRALSWPHPHPIGDTDESLIAAQTKSSSCVSCARLASCRQVQVLHRLPQRRRCML